MSVIESRMNADLVWTDEKPEKKPTHLIVYYQQEHGYATALAGRALIGSQEPIAKIYSNTMTVNSFNFIPAPFWPEYRLYEAYNDKMERFFILRIPNLHPVKATTLPHANPLVWAYTYPTVRDIVMLLNDVGVNRMTYLTSNLFKLHREFEDFGEVEHGHIVEYDFVRLGNEVEKMFGDTQVDSEEDYVLAPNVWIWCDIFATFCENTPRFSQVLLGAVSHDFLDSDGADTFLNHLQLKYGLNHDEEALEDMSRKLSQMKGVMKIPKLEDFLPKEGKFMSDDFYEGDTDYGDFQP